METYEAMLPEPLLKAIDVAEILNISRAMAYKLMNQGEIRSVVIGSSKRVRLKDLLAFIEASLAPSSEVLVG